jgi:hypothetical protein
VIPPTRTTLLPSDIQLPDDPGVSNEQPLTITNGNVLVLSDLHAPHVSMPMLRRAIYVTKRYFPHIQDVAVIGDSWDFACVSQYSKNGPNEDLDEALEAGARIYRAIGNHFERIWVCNGNHDERIAKRIDARFTLQRLFNSAFGQAWPKAAMQITDLDFLYVDGERPWVLGHPSSYSGQGGKTPADLADLEGCNVATGHNHLVGWSQSKSGKYLGIDIGHMTNADQHYYAARRLSKHTKWNAGFLILDCGHPYDFTERWTDWATLGC